MIPFFKCCLRDDLLHGEAALSGRPTAVYEVLSKHRGAVSSHRRGQCQGEAPHRPSPSGISAHPFSAFPEQLKGGPRGARTKLQRQLVRDAGHG